MGCSQSSVNQSQLNDTLSTAKETCKPEQSLFALNSTQKNIQQTDEVKNDGQDQPPYLARIYLKKKLSDPVQTAEVVNHSKEENVSQDLGEKNSKNTILGVRNITDETPLPLDSSIHSSQKQGTSDTSFLKKGNEQFDRAGFSSTEKSFQSQSFILRKQTPIIQNLLPKASRDGKATPERIVIRNSQKGHRASKSRSFHIQQFPNTLKNLQTEPSEEEQRLVNTGIPVPRKNFDIQGQQHNETSDFTGSIFKGPNSMMRLNHSESNFNEDSKTSEFVEEERDSKAIDLINLMKNFSNTGEPNDTVNFSSPSAAKIKNITEVFSIQINGVLCCTKKVNFTNKNNLTMDTIMMRMRKKFNPYQDPQEKLNQTMQDEPKSEVINFVKRSSVCLGISPGQSHSKLKRRLSSIQSAQEQQSQSESISQSSLQKNSTIQAKMTPQGQSQEIQNLKYFISNGFQKRSKATSSSKMIVLHKTHAGPGPRRSEIRQQLNQSMQVQDQQHLPGSEKMVPGVKKNTLIQEKSNPSQNKLNESRDNSFVQNTSFTHSLARTITENSFIVPKKIKGKKSQILSKSFIGKTETPTQDYESTTVIGKINEGSNGLQRYFTPISMQQQYGQFPKADFGSKGQKSKDELDELDEIDDEIEDQIAMNQSNSMSKSMSQLQDALSANHKEASVSSKMKSNSGDSKKVLNKKVNLFLNQLVLNSSAKQSGTQNLNAQQNLAAGDSGHKAEIFNLISKHFARQNTGAPFRMLSKTQISKLNQEQEQEQKLLKISLTKGTRRMSSSVSGKNSIIHNSQNSGELKNQPNLIRKLSSSSSIGSNVFYTAKAQIPQTISDLGDEQSQEKYALNSPLIFHMEKFVKKTKKKPTLLERKPTQTANNINKLNFNKQINFEDKLMRTNSKLNDKKLEMSFGESLNSSTEKIEENGQKRDPIANHDRVRGSVAGNHTHEQNQNFKFKPTQFPTFNGEEQQDQLTHEMIKHKKNIREKFGSPGNLDRHKSNLARAKIQPIKFSSTSIVKKSIVKSQDQHPL